MKGKRSKIRRIFTGACIYIGACLVTNESMAQEVNSNDTIHREEIINASEHMIPHRRGAEKFESNKGTEHLFFSAAAGIEALPDIGSGSSNHGPRAAFYAGNWFTPVIGFRGGFDYSMWREGRTVNRIGISADYLININAFAARYDPKRLFEVVAVMGASYQVHLEKDCKAVHSYGLHGGLQGKFNISPAFNLFIEPQLAIYPDRIDRNYSWRRYDLIASVMLGITYKPSGFSKSSIPQQGFASVSAGVGNTGDIAVNTEFAVGKWFEKPNINGIRISAGSSTAFLENFDGRGKRDFNVNICVDYLCNLTTLFANRKNRIFDLIFIGGIGSYFPGGDASASVVFNGRLGFQAQAALSQHMGIWVEPRVNIFEDRSYRPDLLRPIRGTMGVMIGTSYKF